MKSQQSIAAMGCIFHAHQTKVLQLLHDVCINECICRPLAREIIVWIHAMILCCHDDCVLSLLFTVAPLVLVAIPLIADLANGPDQMSDIMILRTNSTDQISL